MAPETHPGLNYWQSLAAAERSLAVLDFAAAEHAFLAAVDTRQQSALRVFFTETISDGVSRLWHRGPPRPGHLLP